MTGMFIGTLLSHDVVSAALVTMASTLPQIMFAGFLVRLSGMPWFFRPLSYFSYLRFAFEALLIGIYGFDRCKPNTGSNFIDDLVNAQDPQKLAVNLFESLNITRTDTTRFSYLLGVESLCLEDVLNKTKEYLGVGQGESDGLDYDPSSGTYNDSFIADDPIQENLQNPSYILSYYELNDSLIYFDFACLIAMLFVIKILVYIVLRIKTQTVK